MEFRLLGPLEASVNGQLVELGPAKQRALLVALLLHPNEVLSADHLIDSLWPGRRPQTAENILHGYVSRLRKAIGHDRIVTQLPGYRVCVDSDELDTQCFERLLLAGRRALADKQPHIASSHLREALQLWRGPALADFAFEGFAQVEIARLEENRLAAIEDRFEADLQVGRHSELIAEIEATIAANPLRERLRAQLMLALYRSGRQAEALGAYRRARDMLINDLGIEASPPLQRLQAAILAQDPGLDLPDRATPDVKSPPSPPRSLRKGVTVLLVDLYVPGQIDAELIANLLGACGKRLGSVVTYHGGRVVSQPNQSLVAIFGLPTVHEDDALRAVRAALDAQCVVHDVDGTLCPGSIRLCAKIAIATGEVLAAGEDMVGGALIHDATRLAEAALDGEVLISEATRRLVMSEVEVGQSAQDRAWRLVSANQPTDPAPFRRDSALVGRHEEMNRLRRAFRSVVRRRVCHLFTILGEAGIGKSRLAHEVSSELAQEATALTGRCIPYGEGITFWPLVEALRQAVGQITEESLRPLLGGEPSAELIVQRVIRAFGLGDGAIEADEAFWALRKVFESLARERPLILVIEDIHWAEPTLLAFVEHLADWSRGSPMLIVCLARPELLDSRPTWGGGKLHSSSTVLEGLSADDSATLITMLATSRAALSVGERIRIAEIAGGNPLFIEQVLAFAGDRAAIDSLSIPPTIHALLSARLDRLDDDERRMLEAASIIGREFSKEALASICEQYDRDDLELILERLLRKELVRPVSHKVTARETFRFRHSLIRDATYESLPKEERAGLHESYANWLGSGAEPRHADLEEVLGYHLERAYQCRIAIAAGESNQLYALATCAANHLAAAGRRALNRSDIPAGIALLARSAALLNASDPAKGELLTDLADALHERGQWESSEACLQAARSAAAASGKAALEVHVRVSSLLHRMYVDAEFTTDELVRDGLNALTALLDLGEDRYATRARMSMAWIQLLRGQASLAERMVDEALDAAHASGDVRLINTGQRIQLASWLYGALPVDEAARRCSAVVAGEPSLRVLASAYRSLAVLKAMTGDFADARKLVERDYALLNEIGLAVVRGGAREIHGVVELMSENAVAAERVLRSGLELLGSLKERVYLAGVAAVLAQALYAQGRHDEAYDMTIFSESGGVRDIAAPVHWRATRAKVLANRGDEEEAERLAFEAVTLANKTDFLDLRGEASMDLAEVLRLVGKQSQAVGHVRTALQLFEQKGNIVSAAKANDVLVREAAAVASRN